MVREGLYSAAHNYPPPDLSARGLNFRMDLRLGGALFTFNYTRELPCGVRPGISCKNLLLWRPHTHFLFDKETRKCVRVSLLCFVRV